ncbi:GNAT family N-acetyltransferase [Rhizobium lusitanum]|uniref:GNAT family N-acetyltransferase n=1 Tax=Rhizobium lusitanum TaxID=293958 RepID=A0A6L9U221_9HYPH|nr:GNAT family N-acetyltransferase [Rhizobium lusitanum]NEI68047.1 GNAT family N-acetyltransferase [Rhizobium lusitanum]
MTCEIRRASEADAEAISAVILSALRETNARDYSADIIARVAESFGPAAVRKLLDSRTVFVAVDGGHIVGTASLDGAVVRMVFVAPAAQRRGIGARLMAAIEQAAIAGGIAILSVPSSITAQAFYEALGFNGVGDSFHGDERTIIMQRSLKS